MTRACHDAVRKAVGDVFSDKEIDDFLDRLAARAKRKLEAEPTADVNEAVAQAARELTRDELLASLTQKRAELAARIAREGRRAKLAAMPKGLNVAQRLAAFDLGTERQGFATSSSIDAEGRARAADLVGQAQLGISQRPGLMNRLSNAFGLGDRGVDRLVAREMARLNGAGEIEPTGDDGALHAARVFNAVIERSRQMQNAVGAWIDRLPGYIARQSHDRLKVAGGFWRELGVAGERLRQAHDLNGVKGALDLNGLRQAAAMRAFGAWRDFIKPLLDAKTFDGIDQNDVSITDKRGFGDPLGARASLEDRFLYRVWYDIVTGRHEQLAGGDDLGEFKPPAGLAKAVSRARTLHFKDPDAWMDYNDRYGRGSLFSAVVNQLERAGRNSALMKAYGPNPEAARANEIEELSRQARAAGDPDAEKALNGRKTQANFDALTGRLESPEHVRLALIMRSIRTVESLAKLGSMVLSKTTDMPMTAHTMARAGGTFLSGYDGALRGVARLQGPEAKHVASLLHVGARDFANAMIGRYHGPDGPLGWGSWMSRLHYKLNAFDLVNDGVRSGAAVAFAHHLGQLSDQAFDALPKGTQETFERFGIDARAWDMARAGVEPAEDGLKYWTPEALDKVGDADWLNWTGKPDQPGDEAKTIAAAKDDLGLRFTTLIHNIMDDAVSEPRARERVNVTGGLRAGTTWGEFARVMSQFHAFIRTILNRHLTPAARGYAGRAPAALMAHFIVSTVLAGYLSMQAKQLVAGRDMRDPMNPATWAAALVQGGGLGIYGDYLFGEENRNGVTATLDSFGGPTLSDAEQVASLVRHAIHGDDPNWAGEATRFATSHLPLVNLWYTRAALDYLVLWRLQEAASPGYLQRYEENVRTKQGTDFWLHPTSAAG